MGGVRGAGRRAGGEVSSRCEAAWGGRVAGRKGSLSLSSIMMLIARRHPVTEQSALTVK